MKRQHKPNGDHQVNNLKPEAQEKMVFPRQPVTKEDMEAYIDRSQHGPCFICEVIAGNPEYHHHIIYQDDTAVVFLNKYPVLYGYTLVAPRQHREQVTNDR